jgi:hypothetical protein
MTDRPALYKTTGIAIGTVVGGAFATAYLVHKNLRELGRVKESKEALVIFGSLGIAFLIIMTLTPSDVISSLISIAIPQLLLVLAILKLTRLGDFAEHKLNGGAMRSSWHALVVGLASNLLIAALFLCASLLWI